MTRGFSVRGFKCWTAGPGPQEFKHFNKKESNNEQ